jgi:thymidylate synthase
LNNLKNQEYRNNEEALYNLIDYIMANGREVGPRGLRTKEAKTPLCFTVMNPTERVMSFRHIGCSPLYQYVEGLWMLLGEENPARLLEYSKFPSRFINEETGNLDGAYGMRMRHVGPLQRTSVADEHIDQLQQAYIRLVNDPESRRATIILSNPLFDWNNSSLDIPCTQTMLFTIRDGALNMTATMRSMDLIRGFPNDLAEFQWFQEIMAGWLNIPVGTYTHFINSLHIYDTEWKFAKETLEYEKEYRLYNCVKPLYCRMDYGHFTELLGILGRLECDIIANPQAVEQEVKNTTSLRSQILQQSPEFYQRLVRVLIANRYHKIGWIDDAQRLVSHAKTDLEYYYSQRWHSAEEE